MRAHSNTPLISHDMFLLVLAITGDMDMISNDIKVNNHHDYNYPCTDCKTHVNDMKMMSPPKEHHMYTNESTECQFPCGRPLCLLPCVSNGANTRDNMHWLYAGIDEPVADSTTFYDD